jgi:hypothetical protein
LFAAPSLKGSVVANHLHRRASVESPIYINNLALPSALIDAIERGIWQTPRDADAWLALLPREQIVQPMLYSLDGIKATNVGWWIKEARPGYLGCVGDGFVPGDIDPARSLLIGDLGPDRLIALDYRESEQRPSVVATVVSEEAYYAKVADDVVSFIKALRLMS